MDWAQFFHIYQPADQQADILESIVVQSYRPLLHGFQERQNIRLTLNVPGALLELFDKHGYQDLINILRALGREGRIEFTGSAKFHAFLPLLSEQEIIRQIKINNDANHFFLGKAYSPRGFFPPEMAYSAPIVPIVENLGFQWIILDEIALYGADTNFDPTTRYKIAGTNLGAVFRQRRLSNMIMSAVVRTPESIRDATTSERALQGYAITAMDGETFGHHRPGLEKTLFDLFEMPEFSWRTITDLENLYPRVQEVSPVASTWASSPQDIDRNVQFLSWRDPENPIHALQWEFLSFVIDMVYAVPESHTQFATLRAGLDQALASDHFWWASAKPWWSLEMIEQGAYRLLAIIKMIPDVSTDTMDKAEHYYGQITATAFQWQRSGHVRKMIQGQHDIQRIPFQDRTLGKGGAEEGVYRAFLAMMKDLEQKATTTGEYERAILWRDAAYKLEHKHDIYDAVSAVDLVRTELPHDIIESIIERYKDQYRKIRGGQPEQRD